jgi:aminoglycoside phosphotransferase (APT) family kinase protein
VNSVAAIDPAQAEQVSSALAEYLCAQLRVLRVSFLQAPVLLADGTDTFVYGFSLEKTDIGSPWRAPLVLRIFRSSEDAARAEREMSVQRFAGESGYRTPTILAFERDGANLGLPFAVMRRAAGVNLLKRFEQSPLHVPSLVHTMAEMHAALHRLSPAGCPIPAEGFLVERRLIALATWMDKYELPEARRAYAWLGEHKTAVMPEERSLCHNDFHPLNIVVDGAGAAMVIDWSRAELGDRLHDVARSYVLMSLAQGGGRNLTERALLMVSRFVAGRYLAAYRRLLPFDQQRFHYWQAVLTFQSWVETAPMMALGAEAVGARAGAASGYRRDIVDKIGREFWRCARKYERGA